VAKRQRNDGRLPESIQRALKWSRQIFVEGKTAKQIREEERASQEAKQLDLFSGPTQTVVRKQ
jgi:hypothetical protein